MKEMLLQRAHDAIIKEELAAKLGSPALRVKFGIDPTGPVLHLGRASTVRRLRNLQDMGHTIVLIIGDFTARIGDASDKAAERQPLSTDEIRANMAGYKHQLGRILDMDKVEFRHNSEWLSKLPLDEIIALAQQFTVAQMIERENYALRFKERKPIGLHEFLYPLLQGYDSVAVKADIEVGGTDQLFNLMAGRVVQKHYGQKPQHVLTFDLLEGPDGRKMSTSWGNAIYITDEPAEMFGKVMAINDELIAEYYRVCTDVPQDVIDQVVKDIAAGANPRDTKASLAREIVTIYHGQSLAAEAEAAFSRIFRDKKGPSKEDIKEVDLGEEITFTGQQVSLMEFIVALTDVPSRSEARRLFDAGGIKVNGETAKSEDMVKHGDLVSIGKRRFYKLKKK